MYWVVRLLIGVNPNGSLLYAYEGDGDSYQSEEDSARIFYSKVCAEAHCALVEERTKDDEERMTFVPNRWEVVDSDTLAIESIMEV